MPLTWLKAGPGADLVARGAAPRGAVRAAEVNSHREGAARVQGALVGGVQLDACEGRAAEREVEGAGIRHSPVARGAAAVAHPRRASLGVPIHLHMLGTRHHWLQRVGTGAQVTRPWCWAVTANCWGISK